MAQLATAGICMEVKLPGGHSGAGTSYRSRQALQRARRQSSGWAEETADRISEEVCSGLGCCRDRAAQ